MSTLQDLIVFYEARLDERQKTAEAAAKVCGCCPAAGSWSLADDEAGGHIATDGDPHPGERRQLGRRWNRSYNDRFAARHIVLNDPAAVLADVASKRLIVAVCVANLEQRGDWAMDGRVDCTSWDVVTRMVEPFAEHPDFRPEWRS